MQTTQPSRPNETASAFEILGQWLSPSECKWPASREIALHGVQEICSSDLVKRHPTVDERLKRLWTLLQKTLAPSLSFGTSLMPSQPNVLAQGIRYFRVLVWNLENFTHDRRPAGTRAVNCERNRTRAAVVADLAYRAGADAVLIMETGSDVGEAMTHLANAWDVKEQGGSDLVKRRVHPLVSPGTHAIPEMPLRAVASVADADQVRALMLAGEGYRILPATMPGQITASHMVSALGLLVSTSNHFQTFSARPNASDNIDQLIDGWGRWCLEGLFQGDYSSVPFMDILVLRKVLEQTLDTVQFLRSSRPELELGEIREAILTARELVDAAAGPCLEAGILEVIQLLLLGSILARGWGTLDPSPTRPSGMMGPFGPMPDVLFPSQLPLWKNGYAEPADLVVTCLVAATGSQFSLEAHDLENGPFFTASDGELLIHALMRLGLLPQPHSETYGVIYRPHTESHMEHFLTRPIQGFGMGTFGIYGILHGGQSGDLLVSQTPQHILAGRSALKISFPVRGDLWIPFALHHNRFSGSKEISTMEKNYVKAENEVLARLRTVEDEARFLADGGDKDPPALIVGDFNTPAPYVQAEDQRKSKTTAGQRRATLRQGHVYNMGASGYLRRRFENGQHPETTLRRALSIAKGEGAFSQPYDAVYQPFDFLSGSVVVRSAAIRSTAAFFPPSILSETVKFQESATKEAETSVGLVLYNQIRYTYAGAIRFILGTLADVQPWLSKNGSQLKLAHRLTGQSCQALESWLWKRKSRFEALLWNCFYGSCIPTMEADLFPFIVEAVEEARALVNQQKKELAKKKKEEKALSQGKEKKAKSSQSSQDVELLGSDDVPLLDDEEQDEEAESKTPGGRKGRKKKAPEQRLLDLPDLFKAIRNLESDSDIRLWGAYGGIVSDHLPVLVEIEILV